MPVEPIVALVVFAVAVFLALLPLILLARISHWTHETQAKVAVTNELLLKTAQEIQMLNARVATLSEGLGQEARRRAGG